MIRLISLLMVFSANLNNSSVISWRSVLLVEETGSSIRFNFFIECMIYADMARHHFPSRSSPRYDQ